MTSDRTVVMSVFCPRGDPQLTREEIVYETGLSSSQARITEAAESAMGIRHGLFAVPDIVRDDGGFRVYIYAGFMATFDRTMPTREAAEMWMASCGR